MFPGSQRRLGPRGFGLEVSSRETDCMKTAAVPCFKTQEIMGRADLEHFGYWVDICLQRTLKRTALDYLPPSARSVKVKNLVISEFQHVWLAQLDTEKQFAILLHFVTFFEQYQQLFNMLIKSDRVAVVFYKKS